MRSSSTTAVGPTGSTGSSPRLFRHTTWLVVRRSARHRSKSSLEKRRASRTKTRMVAGTTKSRPATIARRRPSRVESGTKLGCSKFRQPIEQEADQTPFHYPQSERHPALSEGISVPQPALGHLARYLLCLLSVVSI